MVILGIHQNILISFIDENGRHAICISLLVFHNRMHRLDCLGRGNTVLTTLEAGKWKIKVPVKRLLFQDLFLWLPDSYHLISYMCR